MDLKDVSTQSAEIRSRYHDLERQLVVGRSCRKNGVRLCRLCRAIP